MNHKKEKEKALRRAEKERLKGNLVIAKHFEQQARHLDKLIKEGK